MTTNVIIGSGQDGSARAFTRGLTARLNHGCIYYRPANPSDLRVDADATEALMAEAAMEIASLREALRLAVRMRAIQMLYAANNSSGNLIAAKRAEECFDAVLADAVGLLMRDAAEDVVDVEYD